MLQCTAAAYLAPEACCNKPSHYGTSWHVYLLGCLLSLLTSGFCGTPRPQVFGLPVPSTLQAPLQLWSLGRCIQVTAPVVPSRSEMQC